MVHPAAGNRDGEGEDLGTGPFARAAPPVCGEEDAPAAALQGPHDGDLEGLSEFAPMREGDGGLFPHGEAYALGGGLSRRDGRTKGHLERRDEGQGPLSEIAFPFEGEDRFEKSVHVDRHDGALRLPDN